MEALETRTVWAADALVCVSPSISEAAINSAGFGGSPAGGATGVTVAAEPVVGEGEEVAPQYVIHQTPRLQPGNAPLYGTPAFRGRDQVDILWQTITVGAGMSDRFEVRYRQEGGIWSVASLNAPLVTGVDDRVIHSATLLDLAWNTRYEYVVEHFRGDQLLIRFDSEFTTRLAPGDPSPFTFTAYGDSASGVSTGFKQVQTRINELSPDFNLLLGDNFYEFGSHENADARFSAEINPPAAEWIAGQVDYFTIGNHDGILNTTGGQPSRDSYSSPVPVAGVNSFVDGPVNQPPEHNFSFDYGDVHFVSFDSNPMELQKHAEQEVILDYVLADLQASTARWKIVYTHHPIVGTAKSYDSPSDAYFQMALPRLLAAGADLLIAGDSHSYSWTFPLTGFADVDGDGTVENQEVNFVSDSDREFSKGSGLVQVVAGVGGKSLHSDPYPDPFMAGAYSAHANTWPSEIGFSRVEVLPDRLVVTYISGVTGRIVGDQNGDGLPGADEPFFGQFQIVDHAPLRGDLNQDGRRSVADLDVLGVAVLAAEFRADWDWNQDGRLSGEDVQLLAENSLKIPTGDVNGDYRVNSSDLVFVFTHGRYREGLEAVLATWTQGDWNGDGHFDSADLVRLFQQGNYESA